MSNHGRSLRENEYHAITLPPIDPKNQGRYKVHIPELQPLMTKTEGIWVKNHIHKWRYTGSDDSLYGEYKPVQPGTCVMIKFYEDDLNTGYIDRIMSDQILDCILKIGVGAPVSTNDRDDMYLLFKTPKKHNMFIVLEETSGPGLTGALIPNSIHLYYNELRTTTIINEDGYHLYSDDNLGISIKKEYNCHVDKDQKIEVGGSAHQRVDKNVYDYSGKMRFEIAKLSALCSAALVYGIGANVLIALQAPIVKMNCGTSYNPGQAVPNLGENQVQVQLKLAQKLAPVIKKDKPDLEYR